jgi:hypothetical protein
MTHSVPVIIFIINDVHFPHNTPSYFFNIIIFHLSNSILYTNILSFYIFNTKTKINVNYTTPHYIEYYILFTLFQHTFAGFYSTFEGFYSTFEGFYTTFEELYYLQIIIIFVSYITYHIYTSFK